MKNMDKKEMILDLFGEFDSVLDTDNFKEINEIRNEILKSFDIIFDNSELDNIYDELNIKYR